ncbi:DUF2721 domain-containing protein [Pseudocolwellia sp. AS88]|jgi:hypothetical protein|uniref:DUF2721 domain-containing protein n=1 Tax=Pseudocolwellia TaxID=2848177 RepID=UPI0026E95978|nr:DUF2721 domain-containing protein [Pseudocolwellia sp. AS88]MDO7084712.1 DUF2721 domain-containing protein [Pseudocolwellia sp. AS88]
MIDSAPAFGDVSHVIQLALAPAFLLTAIAGMLNVMTGRLARIIDRGRYVAEQFNKSEPDNVKFYEIEQGYLERRRYLASSAITACTLSALLVCLVIAVLFIKAILGVEIKWVVGSLFVSATLALTVGLSYFLREVHFATKTVRIIFPK